MAALNGLSPPGRVNYGSTDDPDGLSAAEETDDGVAPALRRGPKPYNLYGDHTEDDAAKPSRSRGSSAVRHAVGSDGEDGEEGHPPPHPHSHNHRSAQFADEWAVDIPPDQKGAQEAKRKPRPRSNQIRRRQAPSLRRTRITLTPSDEDHEIVEEVRSFKAVAICVCNNFDAEGVEKLMEEKGYLYAEVNWEQQDCLETLDVPGHDPQAQDTRYTSGEDFIYITERRGQEEDRHIFIFFTMGCVGFMNYKEADKAKFIDDLREFMNGPMQAETTYKEEFKYRYVLNENQKGAVRSNRVSLSSGSTLEKLTVIWAFAQSVKLAVYERRVDDAIKEHSSIADELSATGEISMSSQDIAKTIGKLFKERNSVNLHMEILDNPEFFWDHDTFIKMYELHDTYLELDQRVKTLNQRLDIMKELFEMMATQQSHIAATQYANCYQDRRHSVHLELIVIWLIVIECVLSVSTLLYDYYRDYSHDHQSL